MAWRVLFGLAFRPTWSWTRLAVAESQPCLGYGCEASASCPPETFPVACRFQAPGAGHSVWISNNTCVARNAGIYEEDEIRANAACSSMFRTFTTSGSAEFRASCPPGSVLERCFCEGCPLTPEISEANVSCPAAAGSQALCLQGDTNWLLQNADGLGFVKYCGWAPYRRPLTDPDFRNDTDCRDVMLQPHRDYVGACTLQECQGLEDCVARCDLCPNCSAVLYNSRETSGIRCHMQSNVYIESLESSALPVAWSFYVNERNVGCRPEAETDLLSTRGLRGFRLFADLGCSQELVPDQVFALDGGGLVPLQDVWVPRCASAGRCYAGGVSLMATFSSPQVVRCALVDAPEKFSRGWRLAKNSAEISGLLKDLAQAEWLEVARSGASLGVRASWDGLTEVDSGALGGSLASWGATDAGNSSSGGFLSILVALLAAGLCFVAGAFVYLRPLLRGPSQPLMLETRVPPVMLPPASVLLEDEGVLSPEHIDVSAATSTTTEETWQLSFVSSEVFSHLQALLDFTHLSVPDRTAAGAAEPPVAVQLRHALRVKDSAKSRRYASQCGAIRRKRAELKPISPELLSAAAAAKMELKSVIPGPDPAANESYLWYQTSVRLALALAQGHGWEELARGGQSRPIRLTESCAQVEDVFPDRSGYYAGISALLLCRVCVGKFCYMTDAGAEAKREVDSGEFDSILEDNATRRIIVFDDGQVLPEYLLLCSSIGHGEDTFLSPLRLEMPIYWSNLSGDPISAPFQQLKTIPSASLRCFRDLAGASPRHMVRGVRRLEQSQLWLRYARHRQGDRSSSADSEIVSGDLLTNESFLWLASDNEAISSVVEGRFPTSGEPMIYLSTDLMSCLSAAKPKSRVRCVLLCRVCTAFAATTSMAAKAAPSPSRAGMSGGLSSFIPVSADHVYPEFILEVEEMDTE
eukprot:s3052_g1.t1